jgi:MFS transporter, DHA1 family, tetracycline resistance protein
MTENKNRQLFVLFFVLFLELFAYCLIIPALAPLFMDIKEGLLNPIRSEFTRKFLYSVLLMCYPFAQCLGAPLMGAFSDRVGRKRILIITLLGNVTGYWLSAYGVYHHQPFFIFFGFSIAGITGGNLPISQSAISDISSKTSKARNFSYVLSAYGFCYIIGSTLGGQLTHLGFLERTTYHLPFLLAGSLSFINAIFSTFNFKETHTDRKNKSSEFLLNPFKLYRSIKSDHLWVFAMIIFFTFFGWNFYIKMLQIFLIDKYAFTAMDIGFVMAILGVWTVLTQGVIIPFFSRNYGPRSMSLAASLILSVSLFFVVFAKDVYQFYMIFSVICIALVSNLYESERQGKVMGLSQSIQSFAKTLAPPIAGIFAGIDSSLPALGASLSLLLCFLLINTLRKEPTPVAA